MLYYTNKFVLNQSLDHNAYPLNTDNNKANKYEALIKIKHNKIKSFFDYRNVCYKCGKDVGEADQYRECPDKICQTKYCENCWSDVIKTDRSLGGHGNNADMRRFVYCCMCNNASCLDFTIIDKNGSIKYCNDKYINRDGSSNNNEHIPNSLEFNLQFNSDDEDNNGLFTVTSVKVVMILIVVIVMIVVKVMEVRRVKIVTLKRKQMKKNPKKMILI